MDRRTFIKSTCSMCLVSMSAASILTGLSSCAASKVFETTSSDGKIRVPIARFGSESRLIVRTDQVAFDILLVQHTCDTYEAMLLECTHQNNPLTLSGTRIFCATHGSQFDFEGHVLVGPASEPLKTFKTELLGDEVLIELT